MFNVATSIVDSIKVETVRVWLRCNQAHAWEVTSKPEIDLSEFPCPYCAQKDAPESK